MGVNLDSGFRDWLRRRLPDSGEVEVKEIQAPSSGMSAETLLFTLCRTGLEPGGERLVLRCGPRGKGIFPDYDLAVQVGVMRALKHAPVPVPIVRWYEPDPGILGTPFVVMEYIEGVVPSDTAPGFHSRGLFFEASVGERVAMWRAGIEQLARLHSLDWRSLNLPPLPGTAKHASGTLQGQIALLESWIDWGRMGDMALIRRGMQWLRETPLPSEHTSLLWGDARPGNIIFREGLPVALLDWEIASIGMPEFDLFYWWWSSESLAQVNHVERLQGLPDKAQTIAMYEAAAGRSIAEVATYAETFAVLRLAIMNVLGIRAAVSGAYTDELLENNCILDALHSALG